MKVDIRDNDLYVDGTIQSSSWLPQWGYWQHMVPDTEPSSVLMLGAGLGTISRMIKRKYPNCVITGVENNEEIIGLIDHSARESCGLDIVVPEDAFDFINEATDRFDVILVDLWSGSWFPTRVFEEKFIEKLKSLLNPGGKIYINAPNIEKYATLSNMRVKAKTEGVNVIYET